MIPSKSRKDQRLSSTGGTDRKRKQKRNQEGATHLSAPICLVLKEEVFCSFLQKLVLKYCEKKAGQKWTHTESSQKEGKLFRQNDRKPHFGPPEFYLKIGHHHFSQLHRPYLQKKLRKPMAGSMRTLVTDGRMDMTDFKGRCLSNKPFSRRPH